MNSAIGSRRRKRRRKRRRRRRRRRRRKKRTGEVEELCYDHLILRIPEQKLIGNQRETRYPLILRPELEHYYK